MGVSASSSLAALNSLAVPKELLCTSCCAPRQSLGPVGQRRAGASAPLSLSALEIHPLLWRMYLRLAQCSFANEVAQDWNA